MSKPNMYCGECPYWLAFGEPETTDEQNEVILAHCRECNRGPVVMDPFDDISVEEIYPTYEEEEETENV